MHVCPSPAPLVRWTDPDFRVPPRPKVREARTLVQLPPIEPNREIRPEGDPIPAALRRLLPYAEKTGFAIAFDFDPPMICAVCGVAANVTLDGDLYVHGPTKNRCQNTSIDGAVPKPVTSTIARGSNFIAWYLDGAFHRGFIFVDGEWRRVPARELKEHVIPRKVKK